MYIKEMIKMKSRFKIIETNIIPERTIFWLRF